MHLRVSGSERLAASGILVVAIDLRRAKEAPYPASVSDANYGVRWLKSRARERKGDPQTIGADLNESAHALLPVPIIARRWTAHVFLRKSVCFSAWSYYSPSQVFLQSHV